MNRIFWLLPAFFAVFLGCKKAEPPKTDAPKPNIGATSTTPTTETGGAKISGADASSAAGTPATPAEGASKDSAEKPQLDPESAEVDALLRKFIEALATQKTQDAYALMIDAASCTSVMKDATTCDQILLGQAEGKKELEADPVPFNSQIIEVFVGQKQEMGEDKGAKVPSAIWVGNVIRARAPDGAEFMMKSLGVLKTGNGLKILWGKRRSGPDGPRSVRPAPAAPTGDAGAPAAAPGTSAVSTGAPGSAPTALPSPNTPPPAGATGQPTPPEPSNKPTP
ncbi:MAG: hypothetical protein HUU55_03750 [Myxococcales bacterium]|nr:hypothetical protein [Myxococcales bacterium]